MAAHPEQRQMQLTSLNTDCLICLAAYLEGADFCRLLCASRVIAEATAEARADLAAAGDTKKLYSLHFWAISEQRSRPQKEDFHEVLPYLSACFAAPGQPAQQAQPPPQPQQQPQAAAGPQQQQPQQQQQHPALAPRLKLELLTAAARIGGWWQPTAEADGGAAQQLALQALKECFGDSLAAAVASIASDARCPAAAKGFWGCIFLGLVSSMCSEVPDKAAARLVRSLLQAGQPGSLFPDAAAVPVICPLFMAGTAEDPGRVQCCWQLSAQPNYVHYHAQQFVSAVLVLLRYMIRVVNAVGVQGDGVNDDLVKQLHYDIQMVLIQLHNEREAAAVAAVQGRPDEPVWQLNDPAVLQALGFQDGTCLTAEQYQICNYAVPENPRAEAPIVTINALAGCAKTTTLCLLILLHPDLTILYTAYNKAVVEDMKKRAARACQQLGRPCNHEGLPLNVHFMTTHGLANEAYREYSDHPGWNVGGVKGDALVPPLNMIDLFRERQQAAAAVGRHGGASYGMGWLIKDILHEFCTSADDVVGPTHLNIQSIRAKYNIKTQKYSGLTSTEAVLAAQQMWDRIVTKRFSELTVDFNWYLKAFALKVVESGRQLIGSTGRPYDLILVDEAQDVNDVTYQLLMSQRCMIGFVGDRWQHIYGFNNAKDALRKASREVGRPKQAYGLSHSFRLGPMVAEVANRVLHELGEHHQLMIASGRREAAVYAMLEEPEGPPQEPAAAGAAAAAAHAAEDGPAAAAADGAAADGELEEAEEALGAANQQRAAAFQAWLQDNPPYQQLQLLDQPVPPTESTPPQLGAVRIPQYKLGFPVVPVAGGVVMPDNGQVPCLAEARPLYLALPPVNPATGRPFPLMLLCRTNATWFQVAAELAREAGVAGAAIRQKLGRAPRLFLMAGKPGRDAEGQQAQQQNNVEFLQKVRLVYKFRYLDVRDDPPQRNYLRKRYDDYDSMRGIVLCKGDEVDLKAPIILVDLYKEQTLGVLEAIGAVAVTNQESADFLLGTCHKGKGQEEMYAQVADDFSQLSLDVPPQFRQLAHTDEHNLVYVAVTRAMLGLVCNRDVAKLISSKARKTLQIQVAPNVADDAASQQQQQQQQLVACGACRFQFDPAAAVPDTVGNLVIKLQPRPVFFADDADAAADPTEASPLCSTCLAATMLGQLVVHAGAAQQPAQQEQQ